MLKRHLRRSFSDLVGNGACEDASRLDWEKEVVMCFDFRRARSHPLSPTVTSHLPGRLAIYTSKEARVKVLTYPCD